MSPGSCASALAFAVECKTGRGVMTEAQERLRGRWERAGGIFVLAYSVEDLAARMT